MRYLRTIYGDFQIKNTLNISFLLVLLSSCNPNGCEYSFLGKKVDDKSSNIIGSSVFYSFEMSTRPTFNMEKEIKFSHKHGEVEFLSREDSIGFHIKSNEEWYTYFSFVSDSIHYNVLGGKNTAPFLHEYSLLREKKEIEIDSDIYTIYKYYEAHHIDGDERCTFYLKGFGPILYVDGVTRVVFTIDKEELNGLPIKKLSHLILEDQDFAEIWPIPDPPPALQNSE